MAARCRQVIGTSPRQFEYRHPLVLVGRTVKRVGYMHRVLRPRLRRRPQQQPVPQAAGRDPRLAGKGVEVDVVTIVRRPRCSSAGQGRDAGLGHRSSATPARRAAGRRDQADAGRSTEGRADRVFLCQRFRQHRDPARGLRSTSCCRCRRRNAVARHDWDYIEYEPDAEAVLSTTMLTRATSNRWCTRR